MLSENDVHVWRADLNLSALRIQQLAETLSPDEQQRAERFYFERDRQHFIVGRGLLRAILGRYLNLEPLQLEFSYSPRGKPALVNTDPGKRLCFNLSHSHGLALYAVTRERAIGIDLEYIRSMPKVEQLAERFFSAGEYTLISSLPPEQQQEAFFKGWTCKEAYLKATGEGLIGLEQVEVSVTPGEPAALLSIQGDAKAASRWSLHQLELESDYAAALAVEGRGWHLECRTIDEL